MRDLTGQKFHKLTVIKKAGSNRGGSVRWLCLCECGKEKVFSSDHLTRKKSPVKTCGCEMVKKGKNHKQWKGCGEISGGWWSSKVLRERKQNDRIRVPVNITIEYAWELFLKQNSKCALSGIDLFFDMHEHGTASLDRIDSSKGYEEGNVQWVHKDVNFMKRTYSQEYFVDLCKKIACNNGAGGCEV